MSNPSNADRLKTLSRQEATVLYWRCRGWTYKSIGEELGYGEDRVTQLMSIVYQKLGFSKSTHWRVRTGLLNQVFCGEFMALIGNEYGNLEEWPLYGVPLAGDIVRVGKHAPEETREQAPAKPPEEQVPDPEMVALVREDEKHWSGKGQVVQGEVVGEEEGGRGNGNGRGNDGATCLTRALAGFGVLALVAGAAGAVYYFAVLRGQTPAPTPAATVLMPASSPVPTQALPPVAATSTAVPSEVPTEAPTQTAAPTATALPTDTPFVPPADGILFEDNFDSGIKPGWNLGDYWITADGELTQTSQAALRDHYSWATLNEPGWKNYVLSVKINIPYMYSGGQSNVAVAVRTNSQAKYLGVQILPFVGNALFFIGNSNSDSDAVAGSRVFDFGSGSTLQIEANGNNFTVSVDGRKVQQVSVSGYESGGIALGIDCLYTLGCPSFDNVKVTYLP